MSESLLDFIYKKDNATPLLSKKEDFCVNDSVGVSLMISSYFKHNPGRYIILTNNLYSAQKITNLISSFLGNEFVSLFPFDDVVKSELLTASQEILSQRLYVMNRCINTNDKFIIVTHLSSFEIPLVSKEEYINNTFKICIGNQLNLNEFKRKLTQAGYSSTHKINQSLQFAARGDIVDVFPINYENPIRIEFFGDEVDDIKIFDTNTQESIKKMSEVLICPSNDIIFSSGELERFKENAYKQIEKDLEIIGRDKREVLTQNINLDIERFNEYLYHPRQYKYARFIKDKISTILEYFNPDFIILNNEDQLDVSNNLLIDESFAYMSTLFEEGKIISHQEMYEDYKLLLRHVRVLKFNPFKKKVDEQYFNISPLIYSKKSVQDLKVIIQSYIHTNKKVVFLLSNAQQYDSTKKILDEIKVEYDEVEGINLPEKQIGISIFSIEEGFELTDYSISFVSSKELFGFQGRGSKTISKFKNATSIASYEELLPGDYVVHEYNGIGKFLELTTMESGGVLRDFILIEYAKGDKLYVPLSQFRLIRKYSGREGVQPKLSYLNSKEWEKTKSKIKERVNELADRLYKLYSDRASVDGFAFQKDDELQKQFESEFPYELTKDQSKSLEEIKHDMEQPYPMDRLLCGDVGFGKTEVAFRAICKALLSGKQTAILCPTTLLARQHYEVAVERFKNFGINVAILSRLIPERKQKEYIKGIAAGTIHLVIGTHKILSKDCKFKDLGLLVIDEEQRFGVEQKEKIKELKSSIDVLSLSATPIPRTLQLSLIGVRPVSQIETAPQNRTAVQTYVLPYSFEVAKELMERELSRRGQVFYIHNVVSSIYQTADKISQAIPSAKIGVAHGKMDKEQIEEVMERFYSGDLDILVSTSIVENGIDIPNANLIIVEDADKFGLSQLYQIKGRVGRSDQIAYAYLFYNNYKVMNNDAQKRLKAIQDFTQLGSGFKIAQRDLMIRGAGDILGPEQAGFIDSVGLELYLQLLNEVVEERKTGIPIEPPKPVKLLNVSAYLPESYISNEDKLQLYNEVEDAKSYQELKQIRKKMRDIYGKVPDEVDLILLEKKIDLRIEGKAFVSLTEIPTHLILEMSHNFSDINGIGNKLFELLTPYLDIIQLTYIKRSLKIRIKKEGNWLRNLDTITEIIENLYIKCSKEHV